ncbi:uncharacterized protein LOC135650098 [Musa acuminata AAA Group]|uniref:uncharacterized protein LOC135650098 n=1 Tax=Musa acuminata AAA Group TaxID=214697 RepID=UPI0031E1C438
MEKAPTLAANRFHDDSNKEPETLEDKLMHRLSSFSTVIPFSLVIHSLRSLKRLTIWPIYLLGPAPRQKTRRVFLNLGRFGLQTLTGSSYLEDTHLPKQSCPGTPDSSSYINGRQEVGSHINYHFLIY